MGSTPARPGTTSVERYTVAHATATLRSLRTRGPHHGLIMHLRRPHSPIRHPARIHQRAPSLGSLTDATIHTISPILRRSYQHTTLIKPGHGTGQLCPHQTATRCPSETAPHASWPCHADCTAPARARHGTEGDPNNPRPCKIYRHTPIPYRDTEGGSG